VSNKIVKIAVGEKEKCIDLTSVSEATVNPILGKRNIIYKQEILIFQSLVSL